MKKKIFTLLTLLLTMVIGVYADPTYQNIGSDTKILPTSYSDLQAYIDAGWIVTTSDNFSNKGASINPATGDEYETTTNVASKIVKAGNNKKEIKFYITNVSAIRVYGASAGSGIRRVKVTVTPSDNSGVKISYGTASSQSVSQVIDMNLDSSKSYEIDIAGVEENTETGADCAFQGIWFTAALPSGPEITTQPVGASYITGQTIAALTVEATASAGSLTYQWYSCDDAEKTNEAIIDGATSDSYTPTTAGFYFVTVSDDNGSVDSDVVQISISDATAPTIIVGGAPINPVAVGTVVTLTATLNGNPSPSIQWYSNTTASTLGGTAIDGATEETYNPSTATAGTFYFYAVASNSQGDATSELQTIVVKNQVATPTFDPNGSYFEDSKQVTISCTTEDATIHYSTDNGATWTAYTGVLVFTESTTLQAKATKDDYIDSETATATFTKVTLDTQVDVTAAATWDWSKFGTKEIKLTDTSTPSKTTEFVLSNVVNYGLCSSISSDFGNAQQLLVTTEYVVRDWKSDGSNGYMQGGYVKFNTTVPGTLSVRYANTGNRTDEDDRRFLNVNGINYGEGTMNSTMITTDGIAVAAGEVHIKGTLKKDGKDQYLRISKITFTPLTEGDVVSVTDAAYATHVLADDIDFTQSEGVTAYKAKVVGDNIQLIEVEQAPAGTPLVIAATKDVYTLQKATTTPAAVADNDLKAATTTIKQSDATPGNTIYVLNVKNDVVGFYKLSATGSLQAGKAYIEAPSSTSAREMFGFSFYEDATGIKAVKNEKMNVENGEFFNLSGQRVAQPTKGLYIVNGKKVIK